MSIKACPKRRFLAVLPATLVGLLLAQPSASSGNQGASPEARLTGLWLVTVTLTNCDTGEPLPFPGATVEAMALFERDGTMHDTNEFSPLTRSSGFGIWKHLEESKYRFAFRFFAFDATGTIPIGPVVVRHRLVLSENGNRYRSKGTGEFYDVDGNLVSEVCSTSTATRFN
jgi:hypothetical protein